MNEEYTATTELDFEDTWERGQCRITGTVVLVSAVITLSPQPLEQK